MSNRNRRIAKEIADIQSDTLSKISANLVGNGDDLTHLKGSFKGPSGTPYDGGTFTIDVRIPNEYPFKPPIMRFDTKVWHPNVSSQTVCFQSLNPSQNAHNFREPSVSTLYRQPGLLSLPSNPPFCLFNRS